jgi:Zn-dependent protease/CBS domain-containing protein
VVKQSLRLGTIRGIAVGVHWSVVLIFGLFTWVLAEGDLPVHPGHADAADWVAGVGVALVFLLSLFAHELSHAFVAKRNGVVVRSITLFVFGGVTLLEGDAHTPSADFRIAAIGPSTSAALAGIFGGVEALAATASVHGLPLTALSWLWELNLLLAAFNLVPAAPLDGGRILRALLWRHWGDHWRASLAAARFGRGFGLILITLGLLGLFYLSITALWFALIGFFLYTAAVGEEQYALLQTGLGGLKVRDVMVPNPVAVPGPTALSDLGAIYRLPYQADAVVVTDDQGTPIGVVTAEVVRNLPSRQREASTAADIAIPIATVPVAQPDEPADTLVERMVSYAGHPALVFDASGHLVGVVGLTDAARVASWGQRQRQRQRERHGRRAA